jgi:hypothetical protein
MRRHLGYIGLLGILACGIKGPPRPPKPKDKVEVPAAPGTEAEPPWETSGVLEEKPPFELEEVLQ